MAMREVQKITCENAARFVMNFAIQYIDPDTGETKTTSDSGNYPIDQSRTLDGAELDIPEGAIMWPRVHAIAGSTQDGNNKVKYSKNGHVGTYDVKGATLTYSVDLVG